MSPMESDSVRVSIVSVMTFPFAARSVSDGWRASVGSARFRLKSLGVELSRPGQCGVQHAVRKAPLVVEPQKNIGEAFAVGTGLAAIDDHRMRVVVEVDGRMGVIGVRNEAGGAAAHLDERGGQRGWVDIAAELQHQV